MFCSLISSMISCTIKISKKRGGRGESLFSLWSCKQNQLIRHAVVENIPRRHEPREHTFLKSLVSSHHWTSWIDHPFLWNIPLCTALQNHVLSWAHHQLWRALWKRWERWGREVKAMNLICGPNDIPNSNQVRERCLDSSPRLKLNPNLVSWLVSLSSFWVLDSFWTSESHLSIPGLLQRMVRIIYVVRITM